MSQEGSIPSLQELTDEDLDLYEVLCVPSTATEQEIRKAYRRLALKHHPDKVPPSASPSSKDEAHKAFQRVAFAYAVLSDEKRRSRYDATGSTADFDDADGIANWVDFFNTTYKDAVLEATIEKFKSEYKGSEEERRDLLKAYEIHEGDMDKVFNTVMLSEAATVHGEGDEARFSDIIWDAIEKGEVEEYRAFSEESMQKKQRRKQRASKEAKEASKESTKRPKKGKEASATKKKEVQARPKDTGSEMDLLQLIQQRQEARRAGQDAFMEALESKCGGGKKLGKNDEPPEEAFEAMAERQKKRKAAGEASKEVASRSKKSTRRTKK
ncbi:hypothetical protein KEM56_000973 [Ascosphaera pollenicola]|nr:hypothetical protein KEM56_000973 [Ascosphaera pollenicola]